MSENDEPVQHQVRVTWPQDTYQGARPANLFVFTDSQDGLYLAFSHLAPPPVAPPEEVEAVPLASFLIPHGMIRQLSDELARLLERRKALGLDGDVS